MARLPQDISDQVMEMAKSGATINEAIEKFVTEAGMDSVTKDDEGNETVTLVYPDNKQVRDIYRWCIQKGYANKDQMPRQRRASANGSSAAPSDPKDRELAETDFIQMWDLAGEGKTASEIAEQFELTEERVQVILEMAPAAA